MSLSLLNHLSKNGVCGTGTLRGNRTDHCPIKDIKVIGQEYRGSYDYRCDSENKLIVATWNDNSIVTLASNCQPVNPVGTTKPYSRKEKKIVDVPEPSLVKYYNKNISGVDRMYQNI